MFISNNGMLGLFLTANLSLAAMVYGVEYSRIALVIFAIVMLFWSVGLFVIGLISHVPIATAIPGDEFDDQDDYGEKWRLGIKRYGD